MNDQKQVIVISHVNDIHYHVTTFVNGYGVGVDTLPIVSVDL